MVIQGSNAIWFIYVIALSVGGTSSIAYTTKHVLNYIEMIK